MEGLIYFMKVLSNNLSITKVLLEMLKEMYPNTLPVDNIDVETLRYLQGQQSVIHKLETLYEETLEEN
jgi:hypothetical protein